MATPIARTRRAIPAFTGILLEVLTFRETFPAIFAPLVVGAFPCQSALVLQLAVQLNLFSYSGIVLADGLGNCSLGGAVPDAGLDDPPLLCTEMSYFFIGIHNILPFRRHRQESQLYRSE